MKCPNCSFNNIASATTCKICGTELEVTPGANNDTLALDEALKGIFAPKIPVPASTQNEEKEEQEDHTSSWEPIENDAPPCPADGISAEKITSEESVSKETASEEIGISDDEIPTCKISTENNPEAERTISLSKNAEERVRYSDSHPDPLHDHCSETEEEKQTKEKRKEIFLNPLTAFSSKDNAEKEAPPVLKKPVIPVYERAREGINIDEEAENFTALPPNSSESQYTHPDKRRRSKTDEIAAIAMVVLIICLATLIYFAVQMSKSPAPKQVSTPSSIASDISAEDHSNSVSSPASNINASGSDSGSNSDSGNASNGSSSNSASSNNASGSDSDSGSDSNSDSSDNSASQTSTSTSEKTTLFDESYFTKSGNLSGGNGTDEDSLAKVRMGDHYYFHRIVFDFLGDKIPTYHVSILNDGYLVRVRIENITDFTGDYGVATWSTVAKSIEIFADTASSVIININMYEPAMVYTYGLEEPGRIVLDIRGDSNKD